VSRKRKPLQEHMEKGRGTCTEKGGKTNTVERVKIKNARKNGRSYGAPKSSLYLHWLRRPGGCELTALDRKRNSNESFFYRDPKGVLKGKRNDAARGD